MHIRDIRLARLAMLLAEHGGKKVELAKTLQKQPAQVSQWFNSVRTITEDSAREIEHRAKKPHGWLDQPIYPPAGSVKPLVTDDGPALVLTVEERELILRIRQIAAKPADADEEPDQASARPGKHPRAA